MADYDTENTTDLNKIQNSDAKFELNKDDDDQLFNELENDDIPAHIREARLNEIKMKAREYQMTQGANSDIYKELGEEEFLNLTTKSKKCLVHFFHPDFRRCDIMHTHLQKLAQKYTDVKFAKINVEKAKFFVNKLNIQMLPAVLCFVDGILKHRIIGFEQLGNTDNFQTRLLEKRLWKLKFLIKRDNEEDSDDEDEEEKTSKRSIFSKSNNSNNDEDSD